ncbi:hypothetical protein FAZ95_22325 [Trinickia violacea]|uniref:Uncharacterized protein n=1 Tax=Trinickia violacea TaxID=2571746 RepID=A0A4P8IWR3_9BURK|nr:hypothetical protein [Trinickia violacea]QCP51953.1 hypothetical protein FAZ95_22325 [Trinickia violacea]
MSDPLWCVHIEGVEDFVAMGSRDMALREASAINDYLERFENGRHAAHVRAVAIEWPFSPDHHARSLEEDWHDLQQMAHRQAGVQPPKRSLLNVARSWRELIRAGRSI